MTNKDNFDTTYSKVKGYHIIGYDADTDTYSKLHVDQNGHIFAKMLGEYDDAAVTLQADADGKLYVTGSVSVSEDNKAQVVYEDGTVLYICKAAIGSALASSVWQIQKVETADPITTQWCDSNSNYDNVATNLVVVKGLTYG